jgi:N-acetylneuraminic acid mutarotase
MKEVHMEKDGENMARGPDKGLTRREIIGGAAVIALVAASPVAQAIGPRKRRGQTRATPIGAPLRRYMAAAAGLGDGRILVTGGYDKPWGNEQEPSALNSAVIFDPASNTWSAAAPMGSPRARHASVSLADGRVAVLGGLGMNPTGSVEIYDPRTNTWERAASLKQPRYDHTATSEGGIVYVMGGSSNTMLSSLETYDAAAKASSQNWG